MEWGDREQSTLSLFLLQPTVWSWIGNIVPDKANYMIWESRSLSPTFHYAKITLRLKERKWPSQNVNMAEPTLPLRSNSSMKFRWTVLPLHHNSCSQRKRRVRDTKQLQEDFLAVDSWPTMTNLALPPQPCTACACLEVLTSRAC